MPRREPPGGNRTRRARRWGGRRSWERGARASAGIEHGLPGTLMPDADRPVGAAPGWLRFGCVDGGGAPGGDPGLARPRRDLPGRRLPARGHALPASGWGSNVTHVARECLAVRPVIGGRMAAVSRSRRRSARPGTGDSRRPGCRPSASASFGRPYRPCLRRATRPVGICCLRCRGGRTRTWSSFATRRQCHRTRRWSFPFGGSISCSMTFRSIVSSMGSRCRSGPCRCRSMRGPGRGGSRRCCR
jgi:hypothetical protein